MITGVAIVRDDPAGSSSSGDDVESRSVGSRGRLTPSALGVLGFTLLYTAAAVAGAVASGNREFVFYVGVMAVLIVAVGLVHRRVGFSPGVLCGLSAWGLAHMAGGLLPVPAGWPVGGEARVLYNLWLVPGGLKFDQAVHAYGFAVATWACWQGLRAATGASRATVGPAVLCALAGLGLGALNEVVEFAATRLVERTNVGGYENTGWDLVANLVGASLAALGIWAAGLRAR